MTKIIKSIDTKRYTVQLVEDSSGYYDILYSSNESVGVNMSEKLADYNTASYLFDLKVQELEGN